MIGRLRQILPFGSMVLFAVLFLLFEGPVLYVEWKLGRPILDLRFRPGTVAHLPGRRLLRASTGQSRCIRSTSEDYRKWLELTPWTVHKPLPLGPVDLDLGRWPRPWRA